ncbi:hypothetical protein IV454_21000 [Massilia antarctica]|uniref:DUF3828 domain-containing protein n=1 Tax=Massilia antarctica TaxID=2765360 RepID=A0AA48WAP1_9BURK|nr:hypothetical protein [Massilia antarctica]QPI48024.1 hypothetical protein IV454_21000 [Massilia antarctica]
MPAYKNLVLAAALCGGLAHSAGVLVAPAASVPAASTPVALITAFYRDYFANEAAAKKRYLDSGAFYSAGARKLLADNDFACRQVARGDDMCGYGADADMFLDAQDSDPELTLASSGFTAKAVGANAVDVSFKVFPKDPGSQRTTMRYLVVREGGQWRVDDVLHPVKGVYAAKNSMRQGILADIAAISKAALDVADASSWVNNYVEEQQADRFARFVGSPVTVCVRKDACVPYAKDDARLPALVKTLHDTYFKAGAAKKGLPAITAGKQGAGAPKEESVVHNGPFDYTFRHGRWWLSRIDAGRASAAR